MSDVFHVCITFVAILGIPCLLTAQSRPQTFIFHEMKAKPHLKKPPKPPKSNLDVMSFTILWQD